MLVDVYVGGKLVRLNPSASVGKGGEADIFLVNGKALKIFKQPNHPDFSGLPLEQEAARERIAEHQKKLKAFPKNLPPHVIVPEEFVMDRTGNTIVGYEMPFISGAEPLLRYTERSFRQAGISNEMVVKILRDLHGSVFNLHGRSVVIGDFNDLNVLVSNEEAYLIDADSYQFGRFFCRMFTARFVDPLLCDPKASNLMLVKPHNPNSDWYAFMIILFQCLLFVDPYGGVYRPKDVKKLVPHSTRPLRRITVFNPDVRYPKPAIHFEVLPDDLLHHLQQVFEKDLRGVFPLKFLENLRWTKCISCGTEHARATCPECAQVAPAAVVEVTVVRGKVSSTRIFRTDGLILFAAFQEGKLRWLFHESDQFKREDRKVVLSGPLDPQMRYRIHGDKTLFGKGNQLVSLSVGEQLERIFVENFGNLPMFDSNGRSRFWIQSGQLMRDGQFGPEFVGNVLSGQTLFWVGQNFGFGFYRAGEISVSFVFSADQPGINDSVKVPLGRGQLVDSTCVFPKDRCWFFVSTQESGHTINRCSIIRRDGTVEASAEAVSGDGSWLSSIRGKCLIGNLLFSATDDGIVRVESANGQISKTREFPDTEPFVDSGSHLFPGLDCIYVVTRQEIRSLKMS